jgi:hypothetical protein
MSEDGDPLAKSTVGVANTAKDNVSDSDFKPKTKSNVTKQNVQETWDFLSSKTNISINKAIDTAVEFHKQQSSVEDTAETFRNSKEELRSTLRAAFKQEINEQLAVCKKLDISLKPETVELFKSNSDKFIDHIIDNSKAFSNEKLNIDGASLCLRNEVNDFHKKITVNVEQSGWKKVANFCKSCGFDKLADTLNAEHLKNVAKGYSKEISKAGQGLQQPKSKNDGKQQSKSKTERSI